LLDRSAFKRILETVERRDVRIAPALFLKVFKTFTDGRETGFGARKKALVKAPAQDRASIAFIHIAAKRG